MPDLNDNEWIQTYTGRAFWPLAPQAEHVTIEDIARGLATKFRYLGMTRMPITVAQHSVLVSRHVPAADALWGLMHDAGEAYLADVPAPIKHRLFVSVAGPGAVRQIRYRDAENRILAAIARRFSLPLPMPSSIKEIDERARRTERFSLYGPPPRPWRDENLPLLEEFIVPLEWHEAEREFLARWAELTKKV